MVQKLHWSKYYPWISFRVEFNHVEILVSQFVLGLKLFKILIRDIRTCGIRKSRRRFATWMDVTELAAPTTPLITFRTAVLLQWSSAPSILLIDPETQIVYHVILIFPIKHVLKDIYLFFLAACSSRWNCIIAFRKM